MPANISLAMAKRQACRSGRLAGRRERAIPVALLNCLYERAGRVVAPGCHTSDQNYDVKVKWSRLYLNFSRSQTFYH